MVPCAGTIVEYGGGLSNAEGSFDKLSPNGRLGATGFAGPLVWPPAGGLA
jgi:hypothetical protein